MQKEENAFQRSNPWRLASLRNQAAFAAVNQCGSKYKSRFFIVVFAPISKPSANFQQFSVEDRHIHVGFKLSRKTGNAVKRNLLRRRVRALLREANVQEGFACIFIARHGVTTLPYPILREEFGKCVAYISSKAQNYQL